MNSPKKKIDEEPLLIVFAFTIVGLIFLLPRVFSLSINQWSQYLAYCGALLLGLEFLGGRRFQSANNTLTVNAKEITRIFNKFILFYFLVEDEKRGDRRELATWYFFALLDLSLWVVLIVYTLPHFGIDVRGLFEEYFTPWKYFILVSSIYLLPLFVVRRFGTLLNRKVSKFIEQYLKVRIDFYKFFLDAWFLPVAFLFGWITIPWLVFVVFAWATLQILMLVVHLKNLLKLGNVFYVLGFILLLISFSLFIIEQVF